MLAGLKKTGLMGVWWQATALILAVTPVWLTQLGARLPESSTSHTLLAGLVASRFGLWLFDLSVSQMLQEWIPASDIGRWHGMVTKPECEVKCGILKCFNDPCPTVHVALALEHQHDSLLLCRIGERRAKQPAESVSESLLWCWSHIVATARVSHTHVQLCGCCDLRCCSL